jgi:hypothetical protein
MTVTSKIIRIANPCLRVPLWYLWWPVAVACMVGDAINDGQVKRVFTARFWQFAITCFWIGHDGIFAGER